MVVKAEAWAIDPLHHTHHLMHRPFGTICSTKDCRLAVQLIFGSVRSIINLVMREHGIEGSNAFAKTYMPDHGQPRQATGSSGQTDNPAKACQETDDVMRWLLALISDTGMRLSEVQDCTKPCAGCKTPHINLTARPWRRPEDQEQSRYIPLVGTALWASRLMQHESSFAPTLP